MAPILRFLDKSGIRFRAGPFGDLTTNSELIIFEMKLTVRFAIVLLPLTLAANTVVYPPLTPETLVGSWEAITIPRPETVVPDALWHLEVGKKDSDTYLAQVTPDGNSSVVRELISSRISSGAVKLHFATATDSQERIEFPEIWIAGKGFGSQAHGVIDASMFNSDPDITLSSGNGNRIYFVKGTWARDLGNASIVAEKAIDQYKKNRK